MDCNKAEEYFMKYMDGTLSEREAAALNAHLAECEACREDFKLYDVILADFADEALLAAPEGFEEAVMAKIDALTDVEHKAESRLDSLILAVWGTFSVLMGSGFLLSMNRDVIMGYFSSKPALSAMVSMMNDASAYVSQMSASITSALNTFGTSALDYLTSFKYALLFIFGVLAAVQYVMYRRDHRDKVGA
jgi:predicted anti-sigma-YlaC factor YlaD